MRLSEYVRVVKKKKKKATEKTVGRREIENKR